MHCPSRRWRCDAHRRGPDELVSPLSSGPARPVFGQRALGLWSWGGHGQVTIGPEGLEPSFPDPKSGVLPLDEGPAGSAATRTSLQRAFQATPALLALRRPALELVSESLDRPNDSGAQPEDIDHYREPDHPPHDPRPAMMVRHEPGGRCAGRVYRAQGPRPRDCKDELFTEW